MGVCAPFPGKPYFSVEGRKPFTGKSPRRLWGFAPHTRESLILPSRGANLLPGRAPGGCESLRLIPGKDLFHRQGAQTFCREKAPAAVRVCASFPGKPYSSVEGRKLFAGRGAGGRVSLRLTPGKALFHRGGAQTFCREEAPAAVWVCALELGVCASHPGKPYSTVERRKLFAEKSRRRLGEFAPHSRESLILPLRGANFLPGRAPGGGVGLRLIPGKALFHR